MSTYEPSTDSNSFKVFDLNSNQDITTTEDEDNLKRLFTPTKSLTFDASITKAHFEKSFADGITDAFGRSLMFPSKGRQTYYSGSKIFSVPDKFIPNDVLGCSLFEANKRDGTTVYGTVTVGVLTDAGKASLFPLATIDVKEDGAKNKGADSGDLTNVAV